MLILSSLKYIMFEYSHLVDTYHGNVMPLFRDGEAFKETIDLLAESLVDLGVTKVVGLEARGFILSAVAYKLGVGFVAIRKAGKLRGEKISSDGFTNYSGEPLSLEIEVASIQKGDRVAIVDDWFEKGRQGKAAIELLEKLGGLVVGISVIVDDTNLEVKEYLKRYNYKYLMKTDKAE
jgi:adenine phosphoribosyltransferase